MKFKKIVCIGFSESELEKEHWDNIDKLCEARVLSPDLQNAISAQKGADCLLVKLGAKID